MAKVTVVFHRDENKIPKLVEITKGRKKLKVFYEYSPDKDVYSYTLEGRRNLLPSYGEILEIIDAMRATETRKQTVDKVEEVEVIDKISVGTADRGFTFSEIKEFVFEETVLAGTTADKDTFTPDLNGYYEVLSLQVYCSNAPSEAPYIAKNVVNLPAPDTKALIKIPLTLGISPNTYELDLTEKRLIASRTANIIETLTVYEPANAGVNTTFTWKGVFVKYVLPT